MNIPKLLEELRSGLDDLRLIDPNHLYADLLQDSIKAIAWLQRELGDGQIDAMRREKEFVKQLAGKDSRHNEVLERLQDEVSRLGGLLASRTREQAVILHGRKVTAAELLDIVKAGEDRAREVIGLYDLTVAKHAEALRKIDELEGVAEQYRIARDRADEFGRRSAHLDETCKDLASQRDEAIEMARRLSCQLRRKSEVDALLDALQSRPFFAMPGRDP